MNAIRTRRLARTLGLITTAIAALAIGAPSAFAQRLPLDEPGTGATATPIVTHTASSNGLAIWAVIVIAVAAIAVGALVTELVRALSRGTFLRRPATS